MPTSKKEDKYSNMIIHEVTMSGANDLTFDEIDLGLSLFQKVALLISRVEYVPAIGLWAEMTAESDYAWFGLCQSNQLTTLAPNERSVLDYHRITTVLVGTAATALLEREPFVTDWSNLKGNGLLCTPRPLYLAMDTAGFAAATALTARLYFSVIQMTDSEYFELLESRQYYS